jgi:general secretion pathway protein K
MFAKQRGTALITALLVVALASIVATELIARTSVDIRRTENIVLSDQAYEYALAMEIWAVQLLLRDKKDTENDTLNEDWAGELTPATLETANLGGRIEDLNARFNINNLVAENGKQSKNDVEAFRRLLGAVGLEPDLAQTVVDWIDPDIEATLPNGAEDNTYLDLDTPYRVPNSLMVSSTELLLIKGFTDEKFKKLEPYIVALPVRTNVNVNTASAPVLMAMIPELSLDEAQQLIEQRPSEGYTDITAFRGLQALQGRSITGMDVKSDFFKIASYSEVGRSVVRLNTIVQRGSGELQLPIQVIQRSRGKL